MKELELRIHNGYHIKEELKADGYRWNPTIKAWYKRYNANETAYTKNLAEAFEADGSGIWCEVVEVNAASKEEKKYFVKEGWIFNLESMNDKIQCIMIDIKEGVLQFPLEVAGTKAENLDDLYKLLDEANELECRAKAGKVTGSQYGRIKALVNWRVMQRYATCLASGMEENKAAGCFEDL